MNYSTGSIVYMRKDKHIDYVVKTLFWRHKLLRMQISWVRLRQRPSYCGTQSYPDQKLCHNPEILSTPRHQKLVTGFLCSTTIPITQLNTHSTNLPLQSTPNYRYRNIVFTCSLCATVKKTVLKHLILVDFITFSDSHYYPPWTSKTLWRQNVI